MLNLMAYILLAVTAAAGVTALYAFVHAALQRADAYPAADKLTKPVWLAILGLSLLLLLVLWGHIIAAAICACAGGVYLVDVRPKLLEVQGKSR